MYWNFIADLVTVDTELPSRVGHGYGKPVGSTFIAKIYDDDGEHYYTVEFDAEAYNADEDEIGNLYDAYKFAMHDAGATDLRINLKHLAILHADTPATFAIFRDRIARPDGWCSIYG